MGSFLSGFFFFFFLLSIMFSGFIDIIACTSILFLFIVEWYSISLFIHIIDHQSVALRRNVAMNTHVRAFIWTFIFISPGWIPRSGIAGSYGQIYV